MNRITIEPGKRGGQPTVRGLRITVYDVLRLLADGANEDDILALFCSLPATAEPLKNENLLTSLPSDFKVGFEAQKEQMRIAEYVPANETVDNWSRMITVQIFHGAPNVTPDAFADKIAAEWKSACAGSEVAKI